MNNAPRPFRPLQLGHVIQEELAKYLARNLNTENVFLTVLDVVVDKDALHAQVKIGIIPPEKAPEIWEELNGRKRELEHVLLKKFRSRSVPHLSFVFEESEAPAEEPMAT